MVTLEEYVLKYKLEKMKASLSLTESTVGEISVGFF